MAALIALSESKHVSYDVLHRLSTVDILYAENRKKKRSHVKYMDLGVSISTDVRRRASASLIGDVGYFLPKLK